MTGATVSSREGFTGLAQVATQVTKKFLRVVLNGTFFTNDAITHMQVDQAPLRSFCQAPARFAAWTVVLVDPQDPLEGHAIARGNVRGLLQTAGRAEIFGMLYALEIRQAMCNPTAKRP